MMNVLIIGGGQVGAHLARKLIESGHRVRVVESRASEYPRLRQDLPDGVLVTASETDPGVLESAGVRQAHVVAAMSGTDEINLVVTSLARFEFAVRRTIARVNNPKNAWMFTAEMGVDVALSQADLMATLIVEEMSLGDMMTLLKLRKGQYALVEEKVHPQAVAAGQAIGALTLPEKCVLVAIIRAGELLIPHNDLQLQPADEVLAIVHSAQAGQLAGLLGRTAT
jgi:trk system potassium uptake protein TrkA